MSSLLTNNSAMVALQTLKSINKNMGEVQNQISTGKRIANARDNAALWGISTTMQTDVTGFKAISESLSLGSATLSVGRDAAETVVSLLDQMKGKIVAAQEENVDRAKIQADINALRDQITTVVGAAQFNGLNLLSGSDQVSILASLNRDAQGSVTPSNITFNKQDLTTAEGAFGTNTDSGNITIATSAASLTTDGDDAVTASANITFAGTGDIATGDSFRLTIASVNFDYVAVDGDTAATVSAAIRSQIAADQAAGTTAALANVSITGLNAETGAFTLTPSGTSTTIAVAVTNNTEGTVAGGLRGLEAIDVTSEGGPAGALNAIEGLIQNAINAAAAFGSSQGRIQTQSEFVGKLMDGLTSGIGTLVDADMEAASARLQALQVQQQLGIQALSIANQQPQNILALFR